jgi:hypothetical protein
LLAVRRRLYAATRFSDSPFEGAAMTTDPFPPRRVEDPGYLAAGSVPPAPTPSVPAQPGPYEQPSTPDVAKEQAAGVAQSAADAGKTVAGTTKEQTQQVAQEAGRQAKDLLKQTQSELADQASAQQQRAAGNLHALGDELGSMADSSEQNGVATDLIRQAAGRSHDLASWLDQREPGHVLDEIRNFARRRPGTFLALAVGAGLLAGRLTRGIKEDASSDDDTNYPTLSSRASASDTAGIYGGVPISPGVGASSDIGAGAGGYGTGVPTEQFEHPSGPVLGRNQRPDEIGAQL